MSGVLVAVLCVSVVLVAVLCVSGVLVAELCVSGVLVAVNVCVWCACSSKCVYLVCL